MKKRIFIKKKDFYNILWQGARIDISNIAQGLIPITSE